jgi:hypothetical protein
VAVPELVVAELDGPEDPLQLEARLLQGRSSGVTGRSRDE